jgi:hypothetical protein
MICGLDVVFDVVIFSVESLAACEISRKSHAQTKPGGARDSVTVDHL